MDMIAPDILKKAFNYSLQWAEGAFIVTIILLSFNYWNVLSLEKLPIPHFVSGLYIYLLLNGFVLYRRYSINIKKSVASGKTCLFCGSPVLVNTYICSNPDCEAIADKSQKKEQFPF